MIKFVIIQQGSGIITHSEVDISTINLPDEAEVYDDCEAFERRLAELEQS